MQYAPVGRLSDAGCAVLRLLCSGTVERSTVPLFQRRAHSLCSLATSWHKSACSPVSLADHSVRMFPYTYLRLVLATRKHEFQTSITYTDMTFTEAAITPRDVTWDTC